VKNGVGGQLVQLNTIDEKQTVKEFVEGDRKATDEEINEFYPKVNRRMRSALISRKARSFFVEHA
jgi:hypothetical protein